MVAVPPLAPYTVPVTLFTEAIDGAPLLHVPPDGVQLNVLLLPLHHWKVPPMAPGVGLTDTVTVLVWVQKPEVPVRV